MAAAAQEYIIREKEEGYLAVRSGPPNKPQETRERIKKKGRRKKKIGLGTKKSGKEKTLGSRDKDVRRRRRKIYANCHLFPSGKNDVEGRAFGEEGGGRKAICVSDGLLLVRRDPLDNKEEEEIPPRLLRFVIFSFFPEGGKIEEAFSLFLPPSRNSEQQEQWGGLEI